MPSFDGFVRSSPSHCDHNAGLFDRCDVCSIADRRSYIVARHGNRYDVTVRVSQDDRSYTFTFTDMNDIDVYDLTSKLADAGWTQSVPAA